MKPIAQLYPGPDLPLLQYLPSPPLTTRELDVRSLPHGFYRALVRSYALECRVLTILSTGDWLEYMESDGPRLRTASVPRVSQGVDFQGGLVIEAQPEVHDLGVTYRPKPVVVGKGWHPQHKGFDENYMYAVLRALMRIRALGLPTSNISLIEQKNSAKKYPDPTLRFTEASPGAVVLHRGAPAWVIRESTPGVVLVEYEDLRTALVSDTELEVLG